MPRLLQSSHLTESSRVEARARGPRNTPPSSPLGGKPRPRGVDRSGRCSISHSTALVSSPPSNLPMPPCPNRTSLTKSIKISSSWITQAHIHGKRGKNWHRRLATPVADDPGLRLPGFFSAQRVTTTTPLSWHQPSKRRETGRARNSGPSSAYFLVAPPITIHRGGGGERGQPRCRKTDRRPSPLPAGLRGATDRPHLVEEMPRTVPGIHPAEQEIITLHDHEIVGGFHLSAARHGTKDQQPTRQGSASRSMGEVPE